MEPGFRIYNILRPLGWIYGAVMSLRNRIFDRNPEMSKSFPIPVISVGNITVGGTGKTPHTEYIASILKERIHTAVLSRGYGRKTKGFIMADAHSDSTLIGDEPLQIKLRFPDLDVAVCEDRVIGISRLSEICNPQAVILDDAFQHRRVTPSLNILLVNCHRNILDDAMLPAGRLRESAAGRKRADIIIVTKCPRDISNASMDSLASGLAVRPQQQVFFTTLEYGSIYPLCGNASMPAQESPVLAVTGISDPTPMVEELKRGHKRVDLLSYPDHHDFTKRDIAEIQRRLQGMPDGSIIITTAKDAARLSGMELADELKEKIFVLPVKPAFLRDADLFNSTVINHIESFK